MESIEISPPDENGLAKVTITTAGVSKVVEMDFEQALLALFKLKMLDSKIDDSV